MSEQLFGDVETAHGPARAMLCIDGDRTDEFMFHVWGPTITPIAVLMAAEWKGGVVQLTPRIIFRIGEGGAYTALAKRTLPPRSDYSSRSHEPP